eukprot:3179835-Rhodomonas_salina.1
MRTRRGGRDREGQREHGASDSDVAWRGEDGSGRKTDNDGGERLRQTEALSSPPSSETQHPT